MAAELMKSANVLLEDTVPGVNDLISIGISLAACAEKLPGLKGREKMDLVLACLREILSGPVKDKLSPEELKVLNTAIDVIIPKTITLMIDASRAGSFAKKVTKKAFLCVPCVVKKTAAAAAPSATVVAAPAAVVDTPVETDTKSESQVSEPTPASS